MNEDETMQTGTESQEAEQTTQNPWKETSIDQAVNDSTEGEGQGESGEGESGEGDVSKKPAEQVGLTPEQIKDLIQTTAQSLQPRQEKQQKQMTVEEFNRTFNVFQPTAELLTKLGLQPEALPVLHDMLQAVVRQAVTMSEHRVRSVTGELHNQLTSQLTPIQQYYQQQQDKEYASEFLKLNPDLAGTEPLLQSIYARLKAENRRFNTKEEAFKEVADQARAVMKQLKAQGAAQQNPATRTQQNAQPGRKMSTLTGGGQGYAGKASGSVTSAKAIFG